MARLLDRIDSPQDLKRLSVEELPALCQEIRDEIIETCAKNGGHLGSSLGAVEINVALHYVFDSPADRLVWDVGHDAYGVGHASTAISAALGMLEARRLAQEPGKVVAVVGDGALTGGVAFEGL